MLFQIFWNDCVWNSGSEEQQLKRRRSTMKFERIMEFVEYEKNKFCWRWFAILSEMLENTPFLLQPDDYQPLLKLLTEYQRTIQQSSNMKYFIRSVKIMLSRESELKASSTNISETFCAAHWHEIVEHAHKQAVIDKVQAENLDLIRVCMENNIIVSHNFMRTIIIEITRGSNIKKSNSSIKLLISLISNANADLLDDINDLKINVIHWLSPKVKATDLKRAIESDSNLDKALIAQLYVICILNRQCETNVQCSLSKEVNLNVSNDNLDEHNIFICLLSKNLQYRSMYELIVSDSVKNTTKYDKSDDKLPDRSSVKAIFDETINGELEKALHLDDNFNSSINPIEDFNIISTSLTTYVNILDFCVLYESMDDEHFRQSNLRKRILIKISQLDATVNAFDSSIQFERNPEDVNDIVKSLLNIWHGNHHSVVANLIFNLKSIKTIINWLKKQLKSLGKPDSLSMKPLEHADKLEFEQRVQLKCLTLLTHFSAYEQVNVDESGFGHGNEDEVNVFDAIDGYKFNYNRNQDIFMAFEVLKVFIAYQNSNVDF